MECIGVRTITETTLSLLHYAIVLLGGGHGWRPGGQTHTDSRKKVSMRNLNRSKVKDVTSELPYVSVCVYMLITSRKRCEATIRLPYDDDWLFQFQKLSPNNIWFHLLWPHMLAVFVQGRESFFSTATIICRGETLCMPYGMLLTGKTKAEAKKQEKLQRRRRWRGWGISNDRESIFLNNLMIVKKKIQCSFVIHLGAEGREAVKLTVFAWPFSCACLGKA